MGKRIRHLRERAHLSQDDLANQLGLDRASLSQIENDKRKVTAEELKQISNILNLSAGQVLGLEPLPEVHLESETPQKAVPDLRINVPARNRKKFEETLLYILNKVGAKPNIGETVLYKLLYFIDFNYYEKYEEQLMGAIYIKNHHGPTPIEFQEIVKEMIEKGEIELVQSQYFKHLQKKYLPHREPDLSLFNANEIQLIDEVIHRLAGMNAAAISEYSHQDVPWIVTESGKPIDYEAVFYRTPPYSVRKDADPENT
ncbi:MAG: helix-turn-helix domain-containing protein [Verrucomicrobia bacterium]|nr:helix-turn-helix domain-containing protein [Verrucomicrobiota bacterium]